jgi:hypothetical protein
MAALILSPEPCKAQFLEKKIHTLLFRVDMVSVMVSMSPIPFKFEILVLKSLSIWAVLMGQSQGIVS